MANRGQLTKGDFMQLLTKEIRTKLPKLHETESIPTEEKEIICKFFNPCGSGTWYVIEGEQQSDDFVFYGLAKIHEEEFGYFSLNELEALTLPFGLRIERDLSFDDAKRKVKEVYKI